MTKRFKTDVQSWMEKEQKQDEEREHQERRLNIINHHVTQLQCASKGATVADGSSAGCGAVGASAGSGASGPNAHEVGRLR